MPLNLMRGIQVGPQPPAWVSEVIKCPTSPSSSELKLGLNLKQEVTGQPRKLNLNIQEAQI